MKAKAYITVTKPKFLQKIIQKNTTIVDAFNPNYTNHINIFIPKLKPKYLEPCVFLNLNNGRSATLIRAETPLILADALEQVVTALRSDLWLDVWQRLEDVSEGVKNGNIIAGDLEPSLFDNYI